MSVNAMHGLQYGMPLKLSLLSLHATQSRFSPPKYAHTASDAPIVLRKSYFNLFQLSGWVRCSLDAMYRC